MGFLTADITAGVVQSALRDGITVCEMRGEDMPVGLVHMLPRLISEIFEQKAVGVRLEVVPISEALQEKLEASAREFKVTQIAAVAA